MNKTNTAPTAKQITINMTDSDVAPAWLGLCLTAQPGAQDSGRVRYVVTVDGAHADELWAALDLDAEVTDYEVDEVAATCECGAWSGEWCCGEIGTDAVTVEFMPEALRGSHDAAGNRGTYPANGARRIRVTPACANQMASTDGEWCSVIAAEVAAECPACDGSGRVPTFERPCGVDCCGWGTEMCHACRGLGVVAAIALTAETITTAQIRALRTEAATAGDLEQVEICDLALSGSSIRHLSIRGADGRVVSVEEDCRELCADAINAGQG